MLSDIGGECKIKNLMMQKYTTIIPRLRPYILPSVWEALGSTKKEYFLLNCIWSSIKWVTQLNGEFLFHVRDKYDKHVTFTLQPTPHNVLM